MPNEQGKLEYTTSYSFNAACQEAVRQMTLQLNHDRFIGFDSMDYAGKKMQLLNVRVDDEGLVDFTRFDYRLIEKQYRRRIIRLSKIEKIVGKCDLELVLDEVPEEVFKEEQ
jgi:hypothetical protein